MRLVVVKEPEKKGNSTEDADGSDVEGVGTGGPNSPLISLSESGMGWDDMAYVSLLMFFILSCMC